MTPKKTVVKVTPSIPAAASKAKPKKKNDFLWESFQVIIDRQLLRMNIKKVNDILLNDLKIDLKDLEYRLTCVLAELLCYYMKVWPGWSKYESECKNEKGKKQFFEKFREYLVCKIKYIIKNEKTFWNDPPAQVVPNGNMVSKEVQTEAIGKNYKPEAPYSLVISGQPNVLNNIVFIEVDNNIVIKQHAEKPWKTLTISEFLNYSFVFADVNLPDIHLSRSNLHEYQRYITECGDTATCPEVDFITYIRKNRNATPKVYTFNYLSAYFKQFAEIMRQIPGVNQARVGELEEIFKEFLKDIQATNINEKLTMPTSTSICYNIGGNKYIRNKKMVVNSQTKKDTNAINFCEILIPRTAYTLHRFTAEEDLSTEYATFKTLNNIQCLIKKDKASELYPIIEAINKSVTYHCILCPKIYQGEHAYTEMMDHFRFLHKGEQSVLCFKCRRQFDIPKLSGNRWAHTCDPVSAETTTSVGSSKITVLNGTTMASSTSLGIVTTTSQATVPMDVCTVTPAVQSSLTAIATVANNTLASGPPPLVLTTGINTTSTVGINTAMIGSNAATISLSAGSTSGNTSIVGGSTDVLTGNLDAVVGAGASATFPSTDLVNGNSAVLSVPTIGINTAFTSSDIIASAGSTDVGASDTGSNATFANLNTLDPSGIFIATEDLVPNVSSAEDAVTSILRDVVSAPFQNVSTNLNTMNNTAPYTISILGDLGTTSSLTNTNTLSVSNINDPSDNNLISSANMDMLTGSNCVEPAIVSFPTMSNVTLLSNDSVGNCFLPQN